MNISIQLEKGRELFAEIRNGQLEGIRHPNISDFNKYPEKCLYFVEQVVEHINLGRKESEK